MQHYFIALMQHHFIEGNLEVNETSDNMDWWKAEMGRAREEKRRRKRLTFPVHFPIASSSIQKLRIQTQEDAYKHTNTYKQTKTKQCPQYNASIRGSPCSGVDIWPLLRALLPFQETNLSHPNRNGEMVKKTNIKSDFQKNIKSIF